MKKGVIKAAHSDQIIKNTFNAAEWSNRESSPVDSDTNEQLTRNKCKIIVVKLQ